MLKVNNISNTRMSETLNHRPHAVSSGSASALEHFQTYLSCPPNLAPIKILSDTYFKWFHELTHTPTTHTARKKYCFAIVSMRRW